MLITIITLMSPFRRLTFWAEGLSLLGTVVLYVTCGLHNY